MTPTLSTSRLVLRPLLRSSPTQVRWLRDPDVVRYSEQRHRNHTFSTQHNYVASFVGGSSRIWAINLASSGEHIGNLTATHDAPNDVADVGIMIGVVEQWHKGLATEAWRAACDWLLGKEGNVRKLEAGCARNNEAMLKIIQGSGFKLEGERLNHFLFNGNPVGAVLFGRVR